MLNLKKILITFVMSIVFISGQALANEVLNLPNLVFINNQTPKTLLFDSYNTNINQKLLNDGILLSDFKTLVFKQKNEFRYVLYGDIKLGKRFLDNFATINNISLPQKVVNDKVFGIYKEYTPMAAAIYFKNYVTKHKDYSFYNGRSNYFADINDNDMFTVLKNGNIRTTVKVMHDLNGNYYNEILHLEFYQDSNHGPSIRIIALRDTDEDILWPVIKDKLMP